MEGCFMSNLLVEHRGPVTLLTLNRPEVHNSVDAELAVALGEAIETFAADNAARVLVLTGAGELAFSAGANLKGIDDLGKHAYVDKAGPMGFARLDPNKPTIAAVNGYCFAGGMELACWCDFRIASENAEFGALNRRWGVPFTDGGTQRFSRIMGQGNASWLIETGVRIDARRAQAIGLVQEVVSRGRALPRALELAQHITMTGCSPWCGAPGLAPTRSHTSTTPQIGPGHVGRARRSACCRGYRFQPSCRGPLRRARGFGRSTTRPPSSRSLQPWDL